MTSPADITSHGFGEDRNRIERRQMTLQMAYFEREHSPVIMEFGPDFATQAGGLTS